MRTASDWNDILVQCQVKPTTAAIWSEHFAAEIGDGSFSLGDDELDDFLGQVLHESGMLESMEESLNYSVDALIAKFGRHRISIEQAQRYGRAPGQSANQPAIANCLYGGKWGRDNLGNEDAGDGWKFRGSGPGQLTGKSNFAKMQAITGLPLVDNPDLLRRPGREALKVFICWWEGRVPDAVMGNKRLVRKAVNGGDFGLAHASELTRRAEQALS